MHFNRTELCADTGHTLPRPQDPPSTLSTTLVYSEPLASPTTTCEALQIIDTSSSVCRVEPDSCQAVECVLFRVYQITLTLPNCNTVPGVHIQLRHLLDGILMRKVFTDSSYQAVYSGEAKVLDMRVTVEQGPSPNFIKFQVNPSCVATQDWLLKVQFKQLNSYVCWLVVNILHPLKRLFIQLHAM